MKFVRKLHIYLGCFFAPLILLFAVSGAWQVYDLHRTPKDGSYRPPWLVSWISSIHLGKFSQAFTSVGLEECDRAGASSDCREKQLENRIAHCSSCSSFSFLLALVGIGMVVNALSGIYMAFAMIKIRRAVWITLGAGVVTPLLLMLLQSRLL
ncbi:MAG: hypothetical protein KDD64_17210 [Bdellovibrionales bacterium]|nr:hypothetical protein [Bdellovibrionales bacterium]